MTVFSILNTETAEWLGPMLEVNLKADDRIDGDDFIRLIERAMFPAREAPSLDPLRPVIDQLTAATVMAMDWIRFGQLLRDRMGWDDYPPLPKKDS